jgi:dienelactone hydrolase
VAGVVLGLLAASPAAGQVTPDPEFAAQSASSWARSQQRGIDQAANPEFLRLYAPWVQEYATIGAEEPSRMSDVDPFRQAWAPARGRESDVSILNRYGARMHAHLSLPRDDAGAPFPLIVLLPGGTGDEQQYRGLAQGLAENGYAVLGVSVQGDGGSQHSAPDPKYCRPGEWQKPQEMGIQEKGACAGEDPAAEEPAGTLETVALLADRDMPENGLPFYEDLKARKAFGALDALGWALSARNPVRALVDGDRVGIMGHSLGAHGALLAGNGDPLGRFDAVVSLDGYGRLLDTAAPRVPTMFQHAEGNELGGPMREKPDPEDLPGHLDARRFQADGVPTMTVTLGGSTHQDFLWTPQQFAPAVFNASRDGERVSLHYALAWFDRWLGEGRAVRRAARRRLLATRYGRLVDESSIGQGRFDPVGGHNVPPTIAGETARYHLSPFFASWSDFPGGRCADLRAGCR